MADVPPPPVVLRADEAPDELVRFLYYLTRDFVPIGVVEHAIHRARTERHALPHGVHGQWADEKARELVYKS